MLKGYYISKDGIRMNLQGYDFDSYISFLGTCPTARDLRMKCRSQSRNPVGSF